MDKSTEATLSSNLTKEQFERLKELAKYLNKEHSFDFASGFIFGVTWLFDCVINEDGTESYYAQNQ